MFSKRYIIIGSLLDGFSEAAMKNVCLTVENGIIVAIDPVERMNVREMAEIDDLSHCTVVPALIDSSISLLQSPSIGFSAGSNHETVAVEEKLFFCKRHVGYCFSHGVLGVAAHDESPEVLWPECESLLREQMLDIRLAGRDFIRVNYSGSFAGDAVSSAPPREKELRKVLKRKSDKKTVVLANGPQDVADALDAGCDAIEQGFGMGEENLRKMARNKVAWIANPLLAKNQLDGSSGGGTVCCRFSTRYVAPGKPIPGAETFWQKTLSSHLTLLRHARALGITTLIGTGAGSSGILHGESMAEEMKLYMKAGYSLAETIRSGSSNPAAFFGMDDLGALNLGNKATFLVTRGTPQQLPRKLGYLEGIYVCGTLSGAYSKNPSQG